MIWWKEWRETRFGFLTALILLTGLYLAQPSGHMDPDPVGLFLGIFVMFFGTAMAISLGATAISSEVGSDTMPFLLSNPASRSGVLAAKYVVRSLEAVLVFLIPVLCLIDFNELDRSMWVPPYVTQKYILIGALSVLLIFSASFLFSVIFKRTSYAVLGAIVFLAAYMASAGGKAIGATYNLHRVDPYINPLLLLSAAIFAASFFLFKVREF